MADTGSIAGNGFGGALRQERERRGLSLQQLSTETKVGISHLHALEQDEFRSLPGGVFRRGIVRAYLKAVGLDEQGWMQRFQQSHAAQMGGPGPAIAADGVEWLEFAENVRRSRGQQHKQRDWRWWGVCVLFLAVLAAAWLVWHIQLHGHVARPAAAGAETGPQAQPEPSPRARP